MIGILLVSHGKMAEGMKDSVSMIVGEQTHFETLSLCPGEDISKLKTDILERSKALDSGDGVLIFVDLYGASPYNASMSCVQDWNKLGINVRVITGMSLPMVINAACSRDGAKLDELASESVTAGQENIQEAIGNILASTSTNTENDDY